MDYSSLARFFGAVRAELGVRLLFTGRYHPKSNRRVEPFNGTNVSRFRHYVAQNRRGWDTFLYPRAYSCNIQLHKWTKLSPCSLVVTREAPRPASLKPLRHFPEIYANEFPMAAPTGLVHRAKMFKRLADKDLKSLQRRYKKDYDKKRVLCRDLRLANNYLLTSLHWK